MTDNDNRRRVLLRLALAGIAVPPWCLAHSRAPEPADTKIDAPNVVPIDDRLVTCGQPTAAALAGLGARGIRAVIYLAPPTVGDAVREEPAILERQGIEYINIPIPFGAPTEAHFEQFVAHMRRLAMVRRMVHCQVNLRASSMTFLYRAIILKEAPDKAYESVSRVWSPSGAWKPFIESMLKKHGVDYAIL